ncbi:MAG: hypothetical protein AMK70_00625 [Nitrospira bacterium SG8_35_1]|nr:MAG: hypothetical protein AMK70_00625 [Nitrospira bacterium SG8_35_1]
MMKTFLGISTRLIISFLFVLALYGISGALILNPDPSTYGADDGTEIFMPAQQFLGIEIIDVLGGLPGLSTFGFFFEGSDVNDISNRYTIFDTYDQDTNPADAPGLQVAIIDFASRNVFDADDQNFLINPLLSVQDTFNGSGNIGFFLDVNISDGAFTLFSVPELNNGGKDSMATFPVLSSPQDYLLGFEEPVTGTFLGFNLMNGITPSPVPEPGTIILMGTGLLGLFSLRRRKN